MSKLINLTNYDPKNIVFSPPKLEAVPKSTLSNRRVGISTKNSDGTISPLIIETDQLFSFGVSANVNPTNDTITGYSMHIALWDRENPTPSQMLWTDSFDQIVERCKDHIISIRDDVGKGDLERVELKKLSPLYWKKNDKGLVDKTLGGPSVYPKLLVSKKDDNLRIVTRFYDMNSGLELQSDSVVSEPKRCIVRAAIKLDSIYFGTHISLQLKLMEAQIVIQDTMNTRLLGPLVSLSAPGTTQAPVSSTPMMMDSDSESETSEADEPLMSNPTPAPARRGRARK